MTNSTKDKNANKASMALISKHLQQVLDQVAVITAEIEEMKDREGGEH